MSPRRCHNLLSPPMVYFYYINLTKQFNYGDDVEEDEDEEEEDEEESED